MRIEIVGNAVLITPVSHLEGAALERPERTLYFCQQSLNTCFQLWR